VLVAKWRERGKLPPADAELSNGPVWLAETIEPLLEAGGPERRSRRRSGTYEVRALVALGRFPVLDTAAKQRFDEVMVAARTEGSAVRALPGEGRFRRKSRWGAWLRTMPKRSALSSR
jgi:hypothetical protein